MKSYTDLEQSKKLAEILPLESADTIWDLTNPDLPTIRAIPYEDSDYSNKYLNIIPCWSLAALLGVVPEEVSLNSFKDGNWNAMVQQNGKMIYGDTDNPVDACYEMIVKLYGQKLL